MEDNSQKPGLKPVNDNPNQQRKGPKFNFYWIYGIILVAILGAQFFGSNFNSGTEEKSFQDFKSNLLKGEVSKVKVINNDHVEVFLKPGVASQSTGKPPVAANENTPSYSFRIGTVDQFNKQLEEAEKTMPDGGGNIPVLYDQQGDYIHLLLNTILLSQGPSTCFARLCGSLFFAKWVPVVVPVVPVAFLILANLKLSFLKKEHASISHSTMLLALMKRRSR